MATNVFPALDIRPQQQQQPDILGQMGRMAALRQQLAMAPIQLQTAQLGLQQEQLNMDSQRAMMQAIHDAGGDLTKAGQLYQASGRATPQGLAGLTVYQKNLAETNEVQLKNMATQGAAVHNILDPIATETDQTQQAQDWEAARQRIAADPDARVKYGIANPGAIPAYKGPQQVKDFLNTVAGHELVVAQQQKLAEARKNNAEANLNELKGKMIAGARPGQFDNVLQAAVTSLPPQEAAAVYTRNKMAIDSYLSQGDYEGAKKVVENMYSEVAGIEKMHYENQQENIRQALNRQAQFANTQAAAAYKQLDNIWTDPRSGFSQLRSAVTSTDKLISESTNGNQLASSLMPVMTTLGINSYFGLHRISPSEPQAVGDMGSLFTRINTILDRVGTGSVPQATKDDIHQIMQDLLASRHDQMLDNSNFVGQVANRGGANINPNQIPVMDINGNVSSLQAEMAARQQRQQQAARPQPSATPPPNPNPVKRVRGSDGNWYWGDTVTRKPIAPATPP